MRLVFFGFALLFCNHSFSQVFILEGNAMYEEPFFDSSYIASKSIKTIHASVAVKDEGLPIRKTKTTWTFDFLKNGNLKRHIKILDKGSWIDSASISIRYDSTGRESLRRERDLFGIHFYTYLYDNSLLPTKEIYERPVAYNRTAKTIKFSYDFYGDTVTVKRFLNRMNREFKQEFTKTNSIGQPLFFRDKRHITGVNLDKNWHYNKANRLDSIVIHRRLPEESIEVYAYTYDTLNRVLTEDFSKDGKLETHAEFVYVKGLLDAYLKKDMQTNRITIIEFDYTYY